MEVTNPHYRSAVEHIFTDAAFVRDLGLQLVAVGPGWCETELKLLPKHYQFTDLVHAGVQAAMADHTAGGAGTTLVADGEYVLTVEFKVNLLRAARGQALRCRAEVLKPGRRLIVAESDVFCSGDDEDPCRVAKALVTLAVLQR